MSRTFEPGAATPFGQPRWYDRVAIITIAFGVPLPWLLIWWWLA